MRVEPDLAVGEQNRQLRPGERSAVFTALGELVVRWQELQRPVQVARALQRADQVLILGQPRAGVQLENADRLALQVVVAQDQGGDLVRHADEELVAVAARELAGLHERIEQDLDVDFDVRGVDPGGIVDEIGVEPSAGERVFHPSPLREAEVATFADDFGLQLHAVDADGVVGAITDLRVRLEARLHVGADAAVPQKIHGHLQGRLDDLGRRRRAGFDTQHSARLR